MRHTTHVMYDIHNSGAAAAEGGGRTAVVDAGAGRRPRHTWRVLSCSMHYRSYTLHSIAILHYVSYSFLYSFDAYL